MSKGHQTIQDSEGQNEMSVFYGACWVLGLIAFVQILAIGVALSLERRDTVDVQEVPRYVAFGNQVASSSSAEVPTAVMPAPDVMKDFERLQAELKASQRALAQAPQTVVSSEDIPPMEDPIVERLYKQARKARMQGDMRLAMVKLEEASGRSKNEPAILYEHALVYEAMGVYDMSLDYFHKVYELGSQQAGGLYSLAAQKLSDGFQENNNLLALGRVREFRDKRETGVETIILTVPVVAAIGEKIDPMEVQLEVSFYDKVNGKVTLPDPSNTPRHQWVSGAVDWKGVREELLQVTYQMKKGDHTDDHLFGNRSYYGHVAELYYRGEVIDQQAWPTLLAREKNMKEKNPLMMPDGYLPHDFNHENPLLPVLEY